MLLLLLLFLTFSVVVVLVAHSKNNTVASPARGLLNMEIYNVLGLKDQNYSDMIMEVIKLPASHRYTTLNMYGSRRKVLVASIMGIQMHVKSRRVRYTRYVYVKIKIKGEKGETPNYG